jgi:tetratricopeptide (TPR) repeat protein
MSSEEYFVQDVLNTLIKGYNDTKLFFTNTLSDIDFFSESPFLDDAFVAQSIEDLKRTLNNESTQLKMYKETSTGDSYYLGKIREFTDRRNSAAIELAFYLSLDGQQANKAAKLLEGIDDDFKICLDAIAQYTEGDYSKALETSFLYVKTIGRIPQHYLFNRNLSEMLINNQDYKKAIPFLRKAVEKKPEALDLHKQLLSCYRHEDMDAEIQIEEQIINILEV